MRAWTFADYPLFVEWWKAHEAVVVPVEILPLATGYVLERDGVPTCALFAYPTAGANLVTLRWTVGAPGKTMEQTRTDFELLFEGVKRAMKALGYSVFFADVPESIARWIARAGFREASRGNVLMILET